MRYWGDAGQAANRADSDRPLELIAGFRRGGEDREYVQDQFGRVQIACFHCRWYLKNSEEEKHGMDFSGV